MATDTGSALYDPTCMAVCGALEVLKDMVTCSICFEAFEGRDPRSLPCLHVFCCKCIQDCLDAKQQLCGATVTKLACPLCKATAAIPGGSAANLPAYFPGVQIQSAIEQMKEKHSICKVCESKTHKVEVVSYCFQCTTAMCSSCREKHDRRRGDHTVTTVTTSTISKLVCSEHDKYMEAYCIDCRQPVCSRCQIGNHGDHRITHFTCGIDQRLIDLDSSLSSITASADLVFAKLVNITSEFEKHLNLTLEELDQHHADTIEHLTQQHETFRTQLQHRLEQGNQELERVVTKMKESSRLLVQLKSEIESLKHPLTEVPDVSIANTDDVIAAIKQQIPTFEATFQLRRLVFLPYSGTVSLGRIDEEREDVTLDPLITDDSRLPTIPEPELLWSVDCGRNRYLDFLPNGDLITSNGAFGIHVYDCTSGRRCNRALSTVCEGYNILALSVNTAKSMVAILHSTVRMGPGSLTVVQTESKTRQTHRVCDAAWLLARTRGGDYIVGSSFCILYKYSSKGHQIWEKELSEFLSCITVDHHDRIIVCSGWQGVIFDQDGQTMLAFPTSTDQMNLQPIAICVDSKDNILVADESGSVLLYDNKGNFLRKILQVNDTPLIVGLQMDKYMSLEVTHKGSDRKLCVYEVSLQV